MTYIHYYKELPMTAWKLSRTVLSAVFAVGVMVSLATANDANQLTKVTFGESVEIPGAVLPAGSYWFVLVGSDFTRNIVRIYSSDWKTVYATESTVNTGHLEPAPGTTITLAERPSSQPQALLEWRFPGETVGHEFQYRKPEKKELAQDRKERLVLERSGF